MSEAMSTSHSRKKKFFSSTLMISTVKKILLPNFPLPDIFAPEVQLRGTSNEKNWISYSSILGAQVHNLKFDPSFYELCVLNEQVINLLQSIGFHSIHHYRILDIRFGMYFILLNASRITNIIVHYNSTYDYHFYSLFVDVSFLAIAKIDWLVLIVTII